MTKQQQPPDLLKRYLCGEEPQSVELATAPVLDRWSVAVTKPSGGYQSFLKGEVNGHPMLADGEKMVSSPIIWLDRNHRWCRTSSRVYRLVGRPIENEGFEA